MVSGVRYGRAEVIAVNATDFYETRAWTLLMLAETLLLAGRPGEAAEQAAQGLHHFDAKGDVTGGFHERGRLAELGISAR